MKRVLTLVRGLSCSFGSLILYWTVLLTFGVKAAIAATLLFVVIDGGCRLVTRTPFPPLSLFVGGAALTFGVIDLLARTPFMLRYEGAIVNLLTAAVFAVGALKREPLVMTLARKRRPAMQTERPEVIRFFRALTVAWALYFVVRAVACLWIMTAFPLVQAVMIRTVVGWLSLGAMLLISIKGRRVFHACRRLGLFEPEDLASRLS